MRRYKIDSAIVLSVTCLLAPTRGAVAQEATPPPAAAAPSQRVLGGDVEKRVVRLEDEVSRLQRAAKFAEAQALKREILAIRTRAQGAGHWQTADAERDLKTLTLAVAMPPEARADLAAAFRAVSDADERNEQGRYDEAESLERTARDVFRRVLGEDNQETIVASGSVAILLLNRGRYEKAELLFREAQGVCRRVLGEDHPQTATCHNGVASALAAQGHHAEAEPLFRRVLEIRRAALGEDDPETAEAFSDLADNLGARGRDAEAEPLFRRALAIRSAAKGEDRADTTTALNNLAVNLTAQGRHAEAEPLFRRALEGCRAALGDDHPDTAVGYINLARLLIDMNRFADAEPLGRRSLAACRAALGEGHPHTAMAYETLGLALCGLGRHAEAEPLYRRALEIDRKSPGVPWVLAIRTYNLAVTLYSLGRYDEAEATWADAGRAHEAARRMVSRQGLERAASITGASPHFPALAAMRARRGQAVPAWRCLEDGLARGLLEDMARPIDPAERSHERELRAQVSRLDGQIGALDALREEGKDQDKRDPTRGSAEPLRKRREALRAELAEFEAGLDRKYGAAAGVAYDLARVQSRLPADAALVAWVDWFPPPNAVNPAGEHWACVVRSRGEPAWVRLKGTGAGGAWVEADNRRPANVRDDLSSRPDELPARSAARAAALAAQRLDPIDPYLGPADGLPAVRRLVVLTSPALAGVPVEALQEARPADRARYTISYAPSATVFAWLRERRRPDPRTGPLRLLALGDPAFPADDRSTPEPPPPDHGAAVAYVEPGSPAGRAGIRPGEVLLRYDGKDLAGPKDVPREDGKAPAGGTVVTVWREGKTLELGVAPGPLGLTFHEKSAAAVVHARREGDRLMRGSRGPAPVPLPGSRREAEAVARLFDRPTVLLGDQASAERLDALAAADDLRRFDVLHLATHGTLDDRAFLQSALLLAWDDRADPVKRALDGLPVYDGRLTAEQILHTWKLDADLVTLSACQSGLGRPAHGEGYLGFAQALFLAGARSLVLSLWKVDDDATALLMARFYADLIGRGDRPGTPLPRAEALREAKQWLRGLSRDQVETALGGLSRGTERRRSAPPAAGSARPFAHPYYWAGFILVGDPG
jgi:tetratricopeptide (TPR) repeat protein